VNGRGQSLIIQNDDCLKDISSPSQNHMTHNIKIVSPNINHLSSIKVWLEDEDEETGQGFYSNWDVIEKAYQNQQMLVLAKDSEPIAFLIYRFEELTARLEITEVAPKFRKSGYGRMIVDDFMKMAHKQGSLAVDLYCSPEESQEFWESVGFVKFPEMPHQKSKIWMYKPLVETASTIESNTETEVIELWQSSSMRSADMTWQVERDTGTNMLKQPVVFPVDDNWRLCWRNNNEMFFEDGIKYFREGNICYGNFLIIRELGRH